MIRLCAFADEADSTLDGQIDALNRNGIRLLELRGVDGQNVADIPEEKARRIQEKLTASGISVFSVGSPIGKTGIGEDFPAHIKKLEHILGLCKIFDCRKIRVFSFFTKDNKAQRDIVLERMRALVALAKTENIDLYHENEKDIYGDVADRVLDLHKNIKGLNFIFDPANFVQVNQGAGDALGKLYDITAYFHIKDAVRASGENVPPGLGDAELDLLIKKIDKETVLTLEPHLALFEGYAGIDNRRMKTKYKFATQNEAFDAAAAALKELLQKNAYSEIGDIWCK